MVEYGIKTTFKVSSLRFDSIANACHFAQTIHQTAKSVRLVHSVHGTDGKRDVFFAYFSVWCIMGLK
jgi:hypothetical protein